MVLTRWESSLIAALALPEPPPNPPGPGVVVDAGVVVELFVLLLLPFVVPPITIVPPRSHSGPQRWCSGGRTGS